jgi:hypothetical protein
VTDKPDTVTVVMYDSASIAAQASSDASVATQYEIQQSQDRPVSARPPNNAPVHTYALTAPAFTATEDASGNYILDEPDTTKWGLRPSGDHAAVTTTLVTVGLQQPQQPAVQQQVNATLTYTVSPLPASGTGTGSPGGSSYSYAYSSAPYPLGNSSASSVAAATGGIITTTIITTNLVSTESVATAVDTTLSLGYGTAWTQDARPSDGIRARSTSGSECGNVCVEVCWGWFGCWCNNWGGPGVTSTATCYTTTGKS